MTPESIIEAVKEAISAKAYAAIEATLLAVREPTTAMLAVGGFTQLPKALTDHEGNPYAGSEGALVVWTAMIDALRTQLKGPRNG